MYEALKETVRRFPDKPGVYLMKSSGDTIIYVGKAKSIKKRVSSYFTGNRSVKTEVLVSKISTIDYILTKNEYEALLLENNLIKEHNPKYNINLKDGKSYPVIRLTAEEYPRIFRTRRIIRDGSEYFGPYTDVHKLDAYLELVEKLFPLRKCKGKLKKRNHPCLYYHIGRCGGPCIGAVSKEEYGKDVESARKLLSGDIDGVVSDLRKRMEGAAKDLNYERAAELRDTIETVKWVGEAREVEDFSLESRDYVALAREDTLCSFVVFQMRDGKMVGRDLFRAEAFGSEDEAFSEFFFRYYDRQYDRQKRLPEVIYTSAEVDVELVERFFREERGEDVRVELPSEDRDIRIMKMASENASQDLDRRLRAIAHIPGLEELKRVLSLKKLPRRIEGFDIAQLEGKYPVASMVSFYNGNPDKKLYRRFHIKTLAGGVDDYEAIREAVARRYTRVLNEGLDKPDLVVIDGGRGQVNAAKEILRGIGMEDTPVIGLAKRYEEIFPPGSGDPVVLPEGSEGLRVLQAVRDETHRFAGTFHRSLRKKDIKLTSLESIPGIGPVRSRKLLEAFGSVEKIAEASALEIEERGKVPKELAERVKEELKKPKNIENMSSLFLTSGEG
ncbi:MAG: excinuclease ABC subunit UvrC [Spirochaetaceae bacterium]